MIMLTTELIADLTKKTNQNIQFADRLKTKTDEELNWKVNADSWSILECIEHLNLYGDFYLPEIQNAIQTTMSKSETKFKSGLVGNYFAKSMLPKDKLNKMKTFKDKNPINSKLTRQVIDRFIDQQKKILTLLDKSNNVSLTKIKIKISITKLVKLRLGDTFRLVMNHNLRHIRQIERIEQQNA